MPDSDGPRRSKKKKTQTALNGSHQTKKVMRERDKLMREVQARYDREPFPMPKGLKPSFSHGYIHYKAFAYLNLGPDMYRSGDYFQMPALDWSAHRFDTVKRGCEQIIEWRGLSPELPLEDIGVEGFYDLIDLFHFRVNRQRASKDETGMILDKMEMQHVVTSEDLVLYNRVRIKNH